MCLFQLTLGTGAGGEGIVTMALGSTIPASLYTLPRLWEQLKTDAQYAQRQAQVRDFNQNSTWLKRGISITPCRYNIFCVCNDCVGSPEKGSCITLSYSEINVAAINAVACS